MRVSSEPHYTSRAYSQTKREAHKQKGTIMGLGRKYFANLGGQQMPLDRRTYDAALSALEASLVNEGAINAAVEFNRQAKTPADLFLFGLDETGSMWEQGDELNTLTSTLPTLFTGDLQKTAFLQIAAFSFRRFIPRTAEEIASVIADSVQPMMNLTPARQAGEIRTLDPDGGTPLYDAAYAMLYSGLKAAERFKRVNKRPVRRLSLTMMGDGGHTLGIIDKAQVKGLAAHIRKQGIPLDFNLFALQKDLDQTVIDEQESLAADLGGSFAHGDITTVLGLTLRSARAPRAFLDEFRANNRRGTTVEEEFVDRRTTEEA